MVSWFLLMVQLLPVLRLAVGFSISKPHCVDHCGDVKVPYPFGIGADCYHDPSYEIICNTSLGFSQPFLRQFNLEVLNISWPGRCSIMGRGDYYDPYRPCQELEVVVPRQNLCGSSGIKKIRSYDLKGSPYRFSTTDNYLMMVGCGSTAALKNRRGEILASCNSVCVGDDFNTNGSNVTTCEGDGCCKDNMLNYNNYRIWDDDPDFYEIDVSFEQLMNYNSCDASVALVDYDSYNSGSLSSLAILPTALRWKAPSFPRSCSDGNTCLCPFRYEGNPYLPDRCQVPQECQKCKNDCQRDYTSYKSTVGYSYYCELKRPSLLRRAAFLGNGGWINLATEFLTEMEEDRVLDMLDARIINEGKEDEFMAIAEIARKCLNMNGKQRPTMKEIAVHLDGIRSSHMPIVKELVPVNSNQGITEVMYADGGPFGNGVFSSEDDPPACSIEVQPLMATEYFTAKCERSLVN